jgi:aminoglycoside phosphotransferase family enzyme/predicted kinase
LTVSQALIAALQNPALFPHPVEQFQVIETHISWVLLTGPFAYKIKKPVNFGFLDFTALADREHFCAEELRLNQRLTEGLYLQVLPITGSSEAPQLNGQGPVIEYALQMRQFPQSQLLDAVQARGELSAEHIDALAGQIARFHQQTPRVAAEHALCNAIAIAAPMRQNFEQIRPMLSDAADLTQLDALEAWTESSFTRLEPLLNQRAANGSVRECHGDIHLGNATLLEGRVVLFDCIEFNEPFRLIDIALDAAFLAMDLEDRDLKPLARRFINAWLEHTGDYQALELINFYKAYRALVRAKVSLFRLGQEQDPEQCRLILAQYRRYANLAESYSAIASPFLAITHGVSAVGKSHVAMRLVESLGAIRLRSDVERKRLLGEQSAELKGQISAGIYSPEAAKATYQRLHQLANAALHAGFSVVLDAAYLKHEQRQAARQVAEHTGAPLLILDCHAPDTVISTWLAQRQAAQQDPSDATQAIIDAQHANREALSIAEQAVSLRIDTHNTESLDSLIDRLRSYLTGL